MSLPPDIPAFYVAGKTADLTKSDGTQIKVLVKRLLSIAVSPVMEVEIQPQDGEAKKAILKLYDPRFGIYRETYPYTSKSDEVWERCVRSGKAQRILKSFQNERDSYRKSCLDEDAIDDDDDDDDDNDDGDEEEDDDDESVDEDDPEDNEATCYDHTQRMFRDEVHAYSKLKTLQGRCIPTFLDSVTYQSPNAPSGLPAKYFDIPGILIEFIPSFPLTELTERLPDQPQIWQKIVADAVTVAKQVNDLGVLSQDYQPRNILAHSKGGGDYQTYLIDFADCLFQEDYKDTSNLRDEGGWAYRVASLNNPQAVAVHMMMQVKKLTGRGIAIDGVKHPKSPATSPFRGPPPIQVGPQGTS